MYTVGDIADKYSISQGDIDGVRDGSILSLYESPTEGVGNIRSIHHDKYTKKIAYGSISNPSVSENLYVCHTQYNNLPDNIINKDSLRPNIACSISGDETLDSVRDCVCGIITNVYKKSLESPEKYEKKIVRIIPETSETKSENGQLPKHVFISELQPEAINESDVLSMGILTNMKQSVQFYFASEVGNINDISSFTRTTIGTQYHICQDNTDPDNLLSMNSKNPLILDGVVVPLGTVTSNIELDTASCCNLIYSTPTSIECTEKCETDHSYKINSGVIEWLPDMSLKHGQEYWLYITSFIGGLSRVPKF